MSSNNDIAVRVNKIQSGLFCCRLAALLKVKPGILAWSPACLWHTYRHLRNFAVLVVQQPPVQWYRVFPEDKERPGRDADLSPLLVPWSRKSIAIPLLPLWAVRPVQSLSACTRVHFTFTFTLCSRTTNIWKFYRTISDSFRWMKRHSKRMYLFFLKIICPSMCISFYSETFARNIFLFDKHPTCCAEDPRYTGLGLHAKYSFLFYDLGNLSLLINFRRNRQIRNSWKCLQRFSICRLPANIQTSTINPLNTELNPICL